MNEISSIHNPRIKQLRELINQRDAREEQGLFIVEGVRLAEEALAHHHQPSVVFFSQARSARAEKLINSCQSAGIEVVHIPDDIFQRISDTEAPQGILMVLPIPQAVLPGRFDFAVILDQIRDPGNTGTILRTAAAAGVQAVFLPPGNADVYSPKVVRSGMGAHFQLNLFRSSWDEINKVCKQQIPPLQLLLAESGGGRSCWDHDLRAPLALVIGGEAEGASVDARRLCDDLIYIPMPGKFESLNAAAAASILIFETVRQRGQ